MPDPFGSFNWICESCPRYSFISRGRRKTRPRTRAEGLADALGLGLHTPSPQCNLFFAQYWNQPSPPLTRVFPSNSSLFELYDVVRFLLNC